MAKAKAEVVDAVVASVLSPAEEVGHTEAARDATALAAAVLEEEAKREAEQAARGAEEVVLPDDLLPGVGGEELPLKEVIAVGGRRTIVVLVGLGMADNLINNGAFQVLAPDIQDTFGLSDGEIGLIAALAGFTIFAAAIPMGALGDRMSRTLIAGVCTIFWSIFAFLTGMVNAVWQLVAARALTGMGQANEQPIQSSLLADAYPIEGRGRIFGIHRGATPLGLLIGPVLAGVIADAAGGDEGWRWAFIVLSLPVLLLGVAALLLPEPKRGAHEQLAVLGGGLADVEQPRVHLRAAFARLKKIKSFYFLMAGLGAFGMAVFAVPTYLNLILDDELGLSAGERGVVGTIVAAGSLVGAIVGGRSSDRLFRDDPPRTMRFMGGALAALGIGFGVMAYSPNVATYVVVGLAAHFALYVGLVPSGPVVAAIVPFRLRSTGFAMVGLYLSLVGGVGGAVIMGTIADASSERTAVAVVAPIASIIAGGLVVYASRFVRQDIARSVFDLIEERDETERIAAGGRIPVLQVRNLDFSYGPVQVLFDVNVDVWEGEVLALLGTNGAGKSTLLRAVTGLSPIDRGVVRLNGKAITFTGPDERLAAGIVSIPGGRATFPTLSVFDNLRARGFSVRGNELDARIAGALDAFPVLAERLEQPAGSLSGGEQQMLAIAGAMMLDPRLLLIDELSLGLAPVVVEQLLATVARLKEAGLTMVIVEQSLNVALTIADRAVFMEKGRVRFEGSAQELMERNDLARAVFLGGGSD